MLLILLIKKIGGGLDRYRGTSGPMVERGCIVIEKNGLRYQIPVREWDKATGVYISQIVATAKAVTTLKSHNAS